MNVFFNFDSFDVEIDKKLTSLVTAPEVMLQSLLGQQACKIRRGAARKIERLYQHLAALPFDLVYPGYLTHPIRVTASYLPFLEEVTYDDVVLGLCHNLKEHVFAGVRAIENAFLSPEVHDRIDRLTIDRRCETDRGYLEQYYEAIAQSSRQLLLFKALDKLDNTLWYVRFNMEPHHAMVIREFVCPRIARVQSRLKDYLLELTDYVQSAQAKEKFIKQVRAG